MTTKPHFGIEQLPLYKAVGSGERINGVVVKVDYVPATTADLVDALIAEGGEIIWWCEEHGSTVLTRDPDLYTMCLWLLHEDKWDALPEPESCRFVKKMLAPIPVEEETTT